MYVYMYIHVCTSMYSHASVCVCLFIVMHLCVCVCIITSEYTLLQNGHKKTKIGHAITWGYMWSLSKWTDNLFWVNSNHGYIKVDKGAAIDRPRGWIQTEVYKAVNWLPSPLPWIDAIESCVQHIISNLNLKICPEIVLLIAEMTLYLSVQVYRSRVFCFQKMYMQKRDYNAESDEYCRRNWRDYNAESDEYCRRNWRRET